MADTYYDSLTNKYAISKTLRFELCPVGETLANIRSNDIIEKDTKIQQDYQAVKAIFDKLHQKIINDGLLNVRLEHLEAFAILYFAPDKSDADLAAMQQEQDALRGEIVNALKSYQHFDLLKKAGIIPVLSQFASSLDGTQEHSDAIETFSKFFTYLTNYTTIRSNLYSDEDNSSTVAHRLITENLPRFLDNVKVYQVAKPHVAGTAGIGEEEMDSLFMTEMYNHLLTQEKIDLYNLTMGKLNQTVNLVNQHSQGRRLPFFKTLHKQLLTEREENYIAAFGSDEQLIETLQDFITFFTDFSAGADFKDYLEELEMSDGQGIYVRNNTDLTNLSCIVAGSWHGFTDRIAQNYDATYTGKKKGEKYEEEKTKALKKVPSYEINYLENLGAAQEIMRQFAAKIKGDMAVAALQIKAYADTIARHDLSRKLSQNNSAVDAIKDMLDAIKTLERDIKLLAGKGDEERKNLAFYSLYDRVLESICRIDGIYNMTRNYLTQKPFSQEKIKLNFNRATFLGGWDRNRETQNLGVLLLKDDKYYLAVMRTTDNKVFLNPPKPVSEHVYRKMNYKLIPNAYMQLPRVFFADRNLALYQPSEEIIDIAQRKKSYAKSSRNFVLEDCHKLIDYYKHCLSLHEEWSLFGFQFRDTKEYNDIAEFYADVDAQGYKLSFCDIDASYVDELVANNQLYLFEIRNKDFSPYSKGNLNLHTIYFKMLFDERNLDRKVYQLNGGAEVFYRPASIAEDEQIVHPAGMPIQNKNELHRADKPTSTMPYDIVKDRRYTEDKFMLHLPITMNYTASASSYSFNNTINNALRASGDVHVIGIDRGEKNLLYVVVVDPRGKIVEQISLNSIINEEYNITTDYRSLLKKKEQERDKARKDWKTIENIKDLKEGYLAQVVHVITALVTKYNAVICLEDLSVEFKRSRQGIESSVYQKFEKMLIDKLNYLVTDKDRKLESPDKLGGALNALQLTAPVTSLSAMGHQTGIIYYVPAALTSNLDPTTGFANFFYDKYENMAAAKAFFARFDGIHYNTQKKYFEFDFDYSKFTDKANGTRTKWTLCTHGRRIRHYRDPKLNNQWAEEEVSMTDAFADLFGEYNVSFGAGKDIKETILAVNEAKFYMRLMDLFKLVLQMRNVSYDGEKEYFISPVMNGRDQFFQSSPTNKTMPVTPAATAAYNIARKGLCMLEKIQGTEVDTRVNLSMSNKQWLQYSQDHAC